MQYSDSERFVVWCLLYLCHLTSLHQNSVSRHRPPAKHRLARIEKGRHYSNMAELNNSLTAMDWLPKLTVGGAMANANGCDNVGNSLQKDKMSVRKSPGSPVNPYATLSEHEAREHQMRESKPPYSYANLITFAINSSETKKMTLSEIYQWICDNFPYYREAGSGWKVGHEREYVYVTVVLT